MPKNSSSIPDLADSVQRAASQAIGSAAHSWDVTPRQAIAIQEALRGKLQLSDRRTKIRLVAGADAAFILPEPRSWKSGTGKVIAAMVVYRFPEMEELERATAVCALTFPYIPGLLSFREIPALVQVFQTLRHRPDLIFCDAHGYAHPRRFGMASHLGVTLNRRTIGCAKSLLTGAYREPGRKAGSWVALRDLPHASRGKRGRSEVIGVILRTVDGVRPIFVSQGHGVSLPTSIRMTLAVCDGRRIPRPTRDADRLAARAKAREVEKSAPGSETVPY